jgi:hypothetical protein
MQQFFGSNLQLIIPLKRLNIQLPFTINPAALRKLHTLDRKVGSHVSLLLMSADANSDSASKSRSKSWKTALLLLGSIAFGGLAIAFWNRNELTQMRDQGGNSTPERSSSSAPPDDETF